MEYERNHRCERTNMAYKCKIYEAGNTYGHYTHLCTVLTFKHVHETCQLRYDFIVTNIKTVETDNDISCVIVTNINTSPVLVLVIRT